MQDIQVMQVPSVDQEDALDEEMEIHSSILSWEIYGQKRFKRSVVAMGFKGRIMNILNLENFKDC